MKITPSSVSCQSVSPSSYISIFFGCRPLRGPGILQMLRQTLGLLCHRRARYRRRYAASMASATTLPTPYSPHIQNLPTYLLVYFYSAPLVFCPRNRLSISVV